MTELTVPPKAALESETDQVIAYLRDVRQVLSGDSARFYEVMAGTMAASFREEFPGIPAGRVLVSVSRALKSIAEGLEQTAVGADLNVLITVTGLAGEQLDREEAARD